MNVRLYARFCSMLMCHQFTCDDDTICSSLCLVLSHLEKSVE